MIDFETLVPALQTLQLWSSALQALFAAILAFLTAVLVFLTYQYSQATKQYAIATDKYVETTEKIFQETAKYAETTDEMLKASIIERQISYIEKRLEKLYMPIHNNQNIFKYIIIPPHIDSDKLGISKFIAEIKPYSYLADDPLRTDLEKLLNELWTLPTSPEVIKNIGKYAELKEEILKQIDDCIKKDRRMLKGMIEEYEIRIRYKLRDGKPVVSLT